MTYAYFFSETNALYTGWTRGFLGISPSYSYDIGYVMSYQTSPSCLSFTDTESSGIAMTTCCGFAQVSSPATSTRSTTMQYNYNANIMDNAAPTYYLNNADGWKQVSWCYLTTTTYTIVAPTPTAITYDLSSGVSATFSQSAFTISQGCTNPQFTYTAASLPSYITLDSNTGIFTITTAATAGSIGISMTATLPNGQTSSVSFTLTVVDCSTGTITETGTAPSDQSYTVGGTTLTYNFPTYTTSNA